VNEIVARTGLPQGYVSECVAKLREDDLVETATDPSDRRRTLVNFGREHAARVLKAGTVPVEDAFASALGDEHSEAL
jgi:DNA-binding MarR family transcriptional regulator